MMQPCMTDGYGVSVIAVLWRTFYSYALSRKDMDMTSIPTALCAVIPSRLRVGEAFDLKVKVLGPVRPVRWNCFAWTMGGRYEGPFNRNARDFQYCYDVLAEWIDSLFVEGGADGQVDERAIARATERTGHLRFNGYWDQSDARKSVHSGETDDELDKRSAGLGTGPGKRRVDRAPLRLLDPHRKHLLRCAPLHAGRPADRDAALHR
jgi:hypothetical protein